MAALTDNAGILFKIKSDSSDAVKDLSLVKGEVSGLGGSFSALASPAAIATAAVAAVGTAAVVTAGAIFRLTAEAAEFGSQIFDATQKTGLSAQTISALKFAADQSGSSLEKISGSVAKFSTLLGNATLGNEKAQKTLDQFGITAKDTDTALAQAITTIAKMTDTTQQSAAAAALFKDRTGEILPVIKSFDGDLPALMAKLKDLGLLMSDEDAKAADEFGDTLDQLKAQSSALGRQFATELMPMITNAMRSISDTLADNKGKAKEWGDALVNVITGVKITLQDLDKAIQISTGALGGYFAANKSQATEWADWIIAQNNRISQALLTGGFSEVIRYFQGVGAEANKGGASGSIGAILPSRTSTPVTTTPAASSKKDDSAERAAREAARIEERNLRARITTAENLLREFLDKLGKAVEEAGGSLAPQLVSDEDLATLKASFDDYVSNVNRAQAALHKLQDQQRVSMTDAEKDLLTQQQRLEKERTAIAIKQTFQKLDKDVTEAERKEMQAASDELERQLRITRDLIAAEEERRKHQLAAPGLEGLIPTPRDQKGRPVFDAAGQVIDYSTAIDHLKESFDALVASMESVVGAQNIIFQVGQLGIQTFQDMASAVGSSIEAWALYGESIGQSLRKALAAQLAHIAAVAAINAIYATALGFLRLAQWDFAAAANAFISAAIWASIAGVAAVGAKGVAGQAFQRQTGQATGAGASAGGAPQTSFTTSNANPFSGNNPLTQSINRHTEATEMLVRKMQGFSPEQVVVLGADGAAPAIAGAYHKHIADDGAGANIALARVRGEYR